MVATKATVRVGQEPTISYKIQTIGVGSKRERAGWDALVLCLWVRGGGALRLGLPSRNGNSKTWGAERESTHAMHVQFGKPCM
eukprot:6172261-Pleurochrysis_carterae.AAC.2